MEILKCLVNNQNDYAMIAKDIPEHLYVNDVIGGTNTVEKAVKIITRAREMPKKAKMDLS